MKQLHKRPRVLIFAGMLLVAASAVCVLLADDAPSWDKWISAGVLALAAWVAYCTARQLREKSHTGRHRRRGE